MRTNTLWAAVVLPLTTTGATAELVASYGFTELSASFNLDSGEFTAEASSANGLATTGDVTAFGAGIQTAVFNPGFYTGGTDAYALFRMDIVLNSGTSAQAENGRILIVDADGDTLSGTFEGRWDLEFGFAFFDGQITSAVFSDTGDGVFEGPGGGSFDNPDGALIGALSFLMPEMNDSMFDQNFDGRVTSGDGMLVPAPGALILAGLGGAAMIRRRR